MDDITHGRIDIYAELGVTSDASATEIASKYRQLALKYHPDKNPSDEAAEKFQFFTEIYTVLQDSQLREQYDEIRRQRESIRAENVAEDVEIEILRFKEQLRRQEEEASRQKNDEFSARQGPGVDVLAMRGLNLRRQLQAKIQQKQVYVSYKDLHVPEYTDHFILQSPKLEVVWKFRPEANAQIDTESLRLILEIFGPIETCSVIGNDGRYVRANAVFVNKEDALKALNHDYKSAQFWDGTPVRKLASLLRSVRLSESPQISGNRSGFDVEMNSFLQTFSSPTPGMAKI